MDLAPTLLLAIGLPTVLGYSHAVSPAASLAAPGPTMKGGGTKVAQYFTQWGIYLRGFKPMDMQFDRITHVIYAYLHVTAECEVRSLDEYADHHICYPELGMTWEEHCNGSGNAGNVRAFQMLRERHPHIKLELSFGGWTKSDYFSGCSKDAGRRTKLINGMVDMLRRTNFDGIDIDWEYPVCCGEADNEVDPQDWSNYVQLLREARAALDAGFPRVHKELSIAMGMGPAVTDLAPKAEICGIIDTVLMMTYDYNGAYQPLASQNAPLYNDPAYVAAGGVEDYNIDWGVTTWLQHCPSSKLIMGFAAYGRGYAGTSTEYGTASGALPGTWESGVLSWWDLKENYIGRPCSLTNRDASMPAGYWQSHRNNITKTPYLTAPAGGPSAYISYDDEESVAVKAKYGKQRGLGGMVWWEASDDRDGDLLNAANAAWGVAPSAHAPPTPTQKAASMWVAATTAAASANRAMALLQLACLLLALVAGIAGGALCWSACRWRWVKTNRPSRSRTSAVKLPPSLEKHLEPLRLADVCREYIDRMPPDAIPISSQVKS